MKKSKVDQAANFGKLVSLAATMGAAYNPTRESLQLAALEAQKLQIQAALDEASRLHHVYDQLRNERDVLLKGIRPMATRIVAVLKANGVDDYALRHVLRVKRQFSSRPKRLLTPEQTDSSPPQHDAPVPEYTRSISHQDIISVMDTFNELLICVLNSAEYASNEADLQPDALHDYRDRFQLAYKKSEEAHDQWRKAEKKLTRLLYDNTGVYGTARAVKAHIISAFGVRDAFYKSAMTIQFSK